MGAKRSQATNLDRADRSEEVDFNVAQKLEHVRAAQSQGVLHTRVQHMRLHNLPLRFSVHDRFEQPLRHALSGHLFVKHLDIATRIVSTGHRAPLRAGEYLECDLCEDALAVGAHSARPRHLSRDAELPDSVAVVNETQDLQLFSLASLLLHQNAHVELA
eukprot:122375-Rhodomonas_salina.1